MYLGDVFIDSGEISQIKMEIFYLLHNSCVPS